ncbi:MAG: acyl-CoA dehydratase activase-related protein [Lachnospiraceae bacterium]|nr:acyl-CoA dehydratase activase-related protein [Lachnospiraceae bacterium]
MKDLSTYRGNCYLGIDAGRTATKAALIAEDGALLYSFCRNNETNPLTTAATAIKEVYGKLPADATIVRSCSTGYNEHLVKAAFLLDTCEVETVAHYYATVFLNPEVEYILDLSEQGPDFIKIKNDNTYDEPPTNIPAGFSRIIIAYGAALTARAQYEKLNNPATTMIKLAKINSLNFETENIRCKGCQENCLLTISNFTGSRRHISGNNCDRGLGLSKNQSETPNLFKYQLERQFDYIPLTPDKVTRGTVGIPRVLSIFESYPFFFTFFTSLGYRVILSPGSCPRIYELGVDSHSSASECYPAKLVYGHIKWLLKQELDFIFYPALMFDQNEFPAARPSCSACPNCPLVISSCDNIKNNINEINCGDVTYKNPVISFNDINTITKILASEFSNIPPREIIAAAKLAWEEQNKSRADIKNKSEEILKYLEDTGKKGIILAGQPYHLDPEINHGIPGLINSYGFAVLTADSVLFTANTFQSNNASLLLCRENLDFIHLSSKGCGLDVMLSDQYADILASSGKLYTCLKIDEKNESYAIRTRVRSLLSMLERGAVSHYAPDSVSGPASESVSENIPEPDIPFFTPEMKATHTILAPQLSPIHFNLVEPAFSAFGYNLVVLPNDNQRAFEIGQKFVNNEACYPAFLVVGQILEALLSGSYDPERTAVMIAQTGGGCQITNYVNFVRRALIKAGMPNIPVIAFNLSGLKSPSGLKTDFKLLLRIGYAIIFGDIFMRCVYRMRPYEELTGSVNKLQAEWRTKCQAFLRKKHLGFFGFLKFRRMCRKIINSFDKIKITDEVKPRVGLVGEILVNYSPAANNSLIDGLEAEGAEVQVPDLIDFLLYYFYNQIYRAENLGTSKRAALLCRLKIHIVGLVRSAAIKALLNSIHFTPGSTIFKIAESAKPIVSLANQAGGGWLLTGEMMELIEDGADNIIYVQPAHCLPGHIVGKGVIKEIKSRFPLVNINTIDYDSTTLIPSYNELIKSRREKTHE